MNYHNRKLSVFLALAFGFQIVSASYGEENVTELESYLRVCEAKLEVLDQSHILSAWKLDQIAKLRAQGFASWQEWQRQSFIADSAQIKLKFYSQFVDFLRQIDSVIENYPIQEGGPKAVRVFLPGSQRLIGWLEGVELKSSSLETDSLIAQQQLHDAENRIAESKLQVDSTSQDDVWRTKAILNLQLAENQRVQIQSTIAHLKLLHRNIENHQGNVAGSAGTTIAADQNPSFHQQVAAIARLEAGSDGHGRLIDRILEREQKRLDSLERLAAAGHVTNNELNRIATHVQRLKSARDRIDVNLANLKKSMANLDRPEYDEREPIHSELAVQQWPPSAFHDLSRIQYLIEQRLAAYEQRAIAEITRRKLSWLAEVVDRLKASGVQQVHTLSKNDRLGELIEIGKQNEIASYQWKMESLAQTIENAETKLQVLRLEEHRFLAQSVLMDDFHESPKERGIVHVGSVQLLNSVLSAFEYAGRSVGRQLRFGYIESNILDTVGTDAELVFSQNPGYPLGVFAAHDDLLRPVKLIDYTRSLNFARRNPVRTSVGPSPTSRITNTGVARRGYNSSNRDIAAPSLYNSPYATDHYRANQIRSSRFYENAYPFGILRSDLRRFARPSQAPWYLPGWPDNLRSNQLRSDYKRNTGGHSGNDLLKSKNYLDLSRPSYID